MFLNERVVSRLLTVTPYNPLMPSQIAPSQQVDSARPSPSPSAGRGPHEVETENLVNSCPPFAIP